MPGINENELVLLKILKDPIFSSGELYQDLLRYLFQCYRQKYQPTETDIAIHVFGKNENFDPIEDTLVRVYFYRLRKKLKQYYEGPGNCDPVQLIIPKGHHYVNFVSVSSRQSKRKLLNSQPFVLGVILLLLTLTIVILSIQNHRLKNSRSMAGDFVPDNFIWTEFHENKLVTSIVIGELFSFYIHKKEYNHEWLIRDDQINSYNELITFLQGAEIKTSDVYLPGWDIVPKSSAINSQKISTLLSNVDIPLDIKITSEVTLEELNKNNLIFIGHFHNLKHLNQYLPNNHFKPSTDYMVSQQHPERSIRIQTSEMDTLYHLTFHYGETSALNSDYVLVSKVPGPNNNVFLFIVSFLPLGRIETVKLLTENDLLKRLETEIRSIREDITPYFEMLIEVKGIEDKGFETRVKHFIPLSSEYKIYQ